MLLGEDELDDLRGDEVSNAQERAGDDHEPDDHSGGLHHLPTVRPLYSLKLAPASLKEVDKAASGALSRRRHCGRCAATPATGPAVLRSEIVVIFIVVTPAAIADRLGVLGFVGRVVARLLV